MANSTESDFPDIVMPKVARIWAYVFCMAVAVFLGTIGVISNDWIASLNYLLAAFFGVALQNVPKVTPNGVE